MKEKNICIIGSGSWGCALAIHSAKLGHNVKMWSFAEEEANLINKERKCKFLPMATMPENIYCTTSIKEAVEGSDMILHVTPSKFFRDTLKKYKEYITSQPVIICSKGFELASLSTLSDVAKEEIPNVKLGAFSGPSHAEEVCQGIPTAIVVASKDYDVQYLVQDAFMNENMRVYTSTDIQGVELRGSIKKYYCFLCRCYSRT